MFEHISAIAVTVVSGLLIAAGLGIVAVGNRTRRHTGQIEEINRRCKAHGLPTSDIPDRLTVLETESMKFREFAEVREQYIGRLESLEATMATRIKVGERGLDEMRSGHSTLLGRIDRLDTKMHDHVDKMESRLRNEIRQVNLRINGTKNGDASTG